MRRRSLKNCMLAIKDEVTGVMINSGGELGMDWVRKLCVRNF